MVLHIRQLRTERVEVHVTEKPGIGIRLVDAGMLIPHANSDMHTFNIKLREKAGNWNWLLVLKQKAERRSAEMVVNVPSAANKHKASC